MSDAYEREQYVPSSALPHRIRPCGWTFGAFTGSFECIADSPIRQNNALLNSLSTKVSALRSVTIDIHDNARDQDTLDHTVRLARCLACPTTYKDACG
jgi:hypothetical protein